MNQIIVIGKEKGKHFQRSNEHRVSEGFGNLGYSSFYYNIEKPICDLCQFDVVLSSHGILHSRNIEKVAIINKRKRNDTKLVIWTFDCLNPKYGQRKKELCDNLFKTVRYWDLVVTTDHSIPWEKYTKQYLHLMQGISETDFSIVPDYNTNPQFDIMFGGMLKSGYDRTKTLQYLSERFNTIYCGNPKHRTRVPKATFHNRIYGDYLTKMCNQVSAVYVPKSEYGVRNYWSNRIYLMGAAGGACVVEYMDGIENEFIDGKHVLFSYSREETADKINELCRNSVLREKLRRSIRKHVFNNYTYTHRCKKILEVL